MLVLWKSEKTKYEDYEVYFECDCPDAIKKREIEEQIRKLKLQIPRENFEVKEKCVLYKKKDSDIVFGGGVSDGFEEGSLNEVK